MKNLILLIVAILLVVWGISYFNKEDVADVDTNTNATSTVSTKPINYSSIQPSLRAAQNGVTVVSYTVKGFAPFIVEVKVGEVVRFVNNRSDKALWVTSTQPENSDLFYVGFGASKSIAKGASFELPFTTVGAWSYTNLNDDNHQGVVIVTE